MNNCLALFVLIVLFTNCSGDRSNHSINNMDKVGAPKFVVQQEIHNFGSLESGEIVYFSFEYKNSGSGLLKIDSIDSGCGCLEVIWPKKVLKEGESDYIKVIFNSSGEWGNIYKPILIYTNTKKKKHEISITANVNNQLFKNK